MTAKVGPKLARTGNILARNQPVVLFSDGSGSDFPGIERVGYFIFWNFRVASGSGIPYFFPGRVGYLIFKFRAGNG